MIPNFLVDGSFVTAKPEPNDVDAVVWLPTDFVTRVSNGNLEAVELQTMLLTRRPEEIFAAEDRRDWDDWLEFLVLPGFAWFVARVLVGAAVAAEFSQASFRCPNVHSPRRGRSAP
jgi:hypothetical protein